MKKAIVITIGSELLIGQVIDTNSAWLGQQLNELGIEIYRTLTVKDEEHEILHAIDYGFQNADLILMTGGLGPTEDDITKKTIASYFNDQLVFHEKTYLWIEKLFKKFGRTPMDVHKQQAYMPESCHIIENKMGTAPGMLFEKENRILLAMPGVPYEMKHIFSEGLKPRLESLNLSNSIKHRTIRTVGMGESKIAEIIQDLIVQFPPDLSIAFLPSSGSVRIRLTSTGESNNEDILNLFTEKISTRLGDLVYGYDETTLEASIGQLAKAKGIKIATAESCTGGLIGHSIVGVPGASAYFEGTITAYSYELKQAILNVSKKTLTDFGAVSEEVVLEMLAGCLDATYADVAISVSGIAGPGGGTPEKPVGTIWMAWGNKEVQMTKKLSLSKSREVNIKYTSVYALNMIRKFLMEQ